MHLVGTLGRDFRFSLRKFRKRPIYFVVNLVTISLGLSTVSVALVVAWGVFCSRIPYPEPDGIVAVFSRFPESPAAAGTSSYPDYVDFRDRNTTLQSLAATASGHQFNLSGTDKPTRVQVNFVSPSYFDILGVGAARGRVFTPDENRLHGGHPVVVLSHGLWRDRFGADPDLLGEKILLNDVPFSVVGMLPRDFRDLSLGEDVDVWIPIMMASTMLGDPYLENRRGRWLHSIGRLQPDASVEQVTADMTRLAERLAEEYPDTNSGIGVTVMPLESYLLRFKDLRKAAFILAGAALLVLVVTVLNVGSLALVDVNRRRSELAMRIALGAERRGLLRHFMVEALTLSLTAVVFAVLLGAYGTRILVGSAAIDVPHYIQLEMGPQVILLTVLLAVLTGLAIGGLQALRAFRVSSRETLEGTDRLMGRSVAARRAQELLIVCEVAAGVVLLIWAGLMFANVESLRDTDLGFEPSRIARLQVELGKDHSDPGSRLAFFRSVVDSVESLPGAVSAGLWGPAQPGSSWWYRVLLPEGGSRDRPEDQVRAFRHRITPGALKALQIPLLRGRRFDWQDTLGTQPVAIVSETMAQRVWPGEDPLGKRFLRVSTPDDPWITVVGVASDARHRGRLPENFNPMDVYLPMAQEPTQAVTVFAETAVDPANFVNTLRGTVQDLAPDLPLFNVGPLTEALRAELNEPRFYAWIIGVFAGIAVFLAITGLYGTLSYAVNQRTREIGVHMVLGADRGHVSRLIGGKLLLLTASGVGLGLLAAISCSRLFASLLHNVEAVDLQVYVLASIVLGSVSLLAGTLPVRRALGINPSRILRIE